MKLKFACGVDYFNIYEVTTSGEESSYLLTIYQAPILFEKKIHLIICFSLKNLRIDSLTTLHEVIYKLYLDIISLQYHPHGHTTLLKRCNRIPWKNVFIRIEVTKQKIKIRKWPKIAVAKKGGMKLINHFFFINEQHGKDMQPMISCLRCNYEYRSSRSENGHHRQQLPLVTTSHSYP